jgi:hypothetical protein
MTKELRMEYLKKYRESKKKETPETKKNFDNFLENYDFEEKPEEENIEESEKTHIRI